MRAVFESWDLTKLPTTPRSLLFALEPIGAGTPFVESLTSYISRLAEVHAVRVSDLAGYVLAKCVPRDAPIVSARAGDYRMGSGFHPGTHAINGLAEDARRWIPAVETATNRRGLRFLTLMPLQQIFSKQSLLRKGQAWCPNCFSEWRQNGLPLSARPGEEIPALTGRAPAGRHRSLHNPHFFRIYTAVSTGDILDDPL